MSFPEDETEVGAPLSPVTEMPPEYPEDEDGTNLVPCSVCNRTFNPTSLQRHEKVCERLQAKKRNKFDSTKQRQDGLDIPHTGLRAKNEKEDKRKKSRWREKHQEFLRTIRAAKGSPEDGENDEDGSPQRNIPSDYVQCPHCERYFGPKAADRHISWCSEQKSRLPRTHTSEDSEAIQRLKTRTKYIPPKPGQNGWRAPKKRDVISSIPPPNTGANITPPGRLITPPSPSQSYTSPHYTNRQQQQRHLSPPPLSPTRKSLPPGPPRYGTGSLGRSAGKQFSSMLASVTGCNPGYGVSSGYGTQSLYGTNSSHSSSNSHPPFNRSASLRLPKKRTSAAGRMARHRDLASDMLASVTLGGKAKREEPEGDEASNMTPYYDRTPSNKTEKERINEQRKENNLVERFRNTSHSEDEEKQLEDDNEEDEDDEYEYSDFFETSEEENLDLNKIKSKREALDREIKKLAEQLKTSSIKNEIHEKQNHKIDVSYEINEHGSKNFDSHQDLGIKDYDFVNSDSDEDFDINADDFYYKSPNSLSGDDDLPEFGLTRPRSVHFEDEFLVRGDYTSTDTQSQNTSSHSWSAGSERSWCQTESKGGSPKISTEQLLSSSRPIKSKSSKESVREILRKRREQMDPIEHDDRRRVRSLEEQTDDRRSKSKPKNSKTKNLRRRNQRKYGISPLRKSVSSDDFSELTQRQIDLPLSASKIKTPNSRSNESLFLREGAVISKKDYAHFKSLVGSRNILKDAVFSKSTKKSILKPKSSPNPVVKSKSRNSRLDNAPYDPFSAAEMQFQDLLRPSKPGGSLRSEMMGSTNSLKHFGLKRFSPDRDISSVPIKPRSLLIGRGSLSLCSLGLDSFDFNSCNTRSPGDESSELESLENSPTDLNSPENGVNDFLNTRLSPSRSTGTKKYDDDGHNSHYGSRFNSRSRSVSSHSNKSNIGNTDENKKEDKVYSWRKSPTPPFSSSIFDSFSKTSPKELSPSRQIIRKSSPGFKTTINDLDSRNSSYNSAWTANSDLLGSPKNYSRYLGGRSFRDQPSGSSHSTTDSIKALRATLDEEMKAQKKTIESLDDTQQRVSSSSSTDSSILIQSSPTYSPVGKIRSSSHPSLPIFCYECGKKYPVEVAKFCCHCGARRLVSTG